MAMSTYLETLRPWVQADESPVTLGATNVALVPTARYAGMGTQFFDTYGKKLRLRAAGKMTTSTSPGNLTLALLWGTNANANGTSLVASAAQTLIASQTNITWSLDVYVHCRGTGATGSLFAMGSAVFGAAIIAVRSFDMPASAAAAVGSLDLTGSNVPSLQALVSSGSSITMTVQDFSITSVN
jgi:hypothetical protein